MKEERRFGSKVKFFIDDIEIVCFDVLDSGIDAITESGMRTHICPFEELELVEYSPEGGLRFLESRESGWKVEHCFYKTGREKTLPSLVGGMNHDPWLSMYRLRVS